MDMQIILKFVCIVLVLLSFGAFAEGNAVVDQTVTQDAPTQLLGIPLKFKRLSVGMRLPLHSLIIMPTPAERGALTVEFDRNSISDDFIRDVFYRKNQDIIRSHPFTQMGVEAVLTKKRLVLNFDSGVIFHLRGDLKYRTFKLNGVLGKVMAVRGAVYCSFETERIQERLDSVFVAWRGNQSSADDPQFTLPSGRVMTITPSPKAEDAPRLHIPRIVDE